MPTKIFLPLLNTKHTRKLNVIKLYAFIKLFWNFSFKDGSIQKYIDTWNECLATKKLTKYQRHIKGKKSWFWRNYVALAIKIPNYFTNSFFSPMNNDGKSSMIGATMYFIYFFLSIILNQNARQTTVLLYNVNSNRTWWKTLRTSGQMYFNTQ